MIIEKISLEKLNPAAYNPRVDLKPGDEEYESLKQSIDTFGFVEPMVWNKRTGNLVSGHQRLKVLKEIGAEETECSVVDLSEADEKLLNIALNKISGGWDEEKLAELLEELRGFGCDLSVAGFNDDEISELIDSFAVIDPIDDDFDLDTAVNDCTEPITQRGDMWILGQHRLICGDSTEASVLEILMDGELADLVVTDPPYNVDYRGGVKQDREAIENDCMSDNEYSNFLSAAFREVSDRLKAGGAFYVWLADIERLIVEQALKNADLQVRQHLVWVKNHFVMGRSDYHWRHEPCLYGWKGGAAHYFTDDRTQSTVIETSKPVVSKEHPTMKPVELFCRLIANSSRRNEIVLDTFAGSGTTIIACEQLGRKARCVELSEKYCDVIARRYAEFVGNGCVQLMRGGDIKEIEF